MAQLHLAQGRGAAPASELMGPDTKAEALRWREVEKCLARPAGPSARRSSKWRG
jgi:hypothetical protein